MCAGALSLVSGAISAVSQFQQGKAQAALHKHQAQVQRRNAKITRDRNALKGADLNREKRQVIGESIAAAASGGLDTTGSVALAIRDKGAAYERKIASLQLDAEVERQNHLIEADRADAQARIAKSAATSGFVSSLFGLAGKAAKSFSPTRSTSLGGFN